MKNIVFAISLTALSMACWAQHKPERDPFVQKGTPIVLETPVAHTPAAVLTPRSHPQASAIPTPKLKVLGLVTHSRQPKAIVAGQNSTYIVSQGDKLGDYRVAKIDRSGITLALKQNRYHCPIGQ